MPQAIVHSTSNDGRGAVKNPVTGKTVFVENAWPGDRINFDRSGRVKEVLELEDNRVAPFCPHHGFSQLSCRGCVWMGIKYEKQLKEKFNKLKYLLLKLDLTDEAEGLGAIVPCRVSTGYRNRSQLKTDGEIVGYATKDGRNIVPISDCPALNDKCRLLLRDFSSTLPRTDFKPSPGFSWNYFDIDDDMSSIDEIVLNRRRPFRQGNHEQNEWMKDWLNKKIGNLDAVGEILELYCGSGNLTEVLSKTEASSVVAAEVNKAAVDVLVAKNLSRVSARVADLKRKESLRQILDQAREAQVLVADPARDGIFHRDFIFKKLRNLRHFFYISCNPEKMVHDIYHLKLKGWEVEEIVGIDHFPNTPHLEGLVHMRTPHQL